MQILQWLFKVAKETSPSNSIQAASTVQNPVCKDLVLYKRSPSYGRLKRSEGEVEYEDLSTCFYSTLNLKILGSFSRSKRWLCEVIIKEENLSQEFHMGHKGDIATYVGNKVLPISDAPGPTTTANDQLETSEKRDQLKGNKTKAISRMKELLRWAAAANKAEKGGKYISKKLLYFRTRGALKEVAQEDDSSLSSPKISFRWDIGSCSTSSAYSGFSFTSCSTRTGRTRIKPPLIDTAADDVSDLDSNTKDAIASRQDSDEQCTSRRGGNWITTDEEFVVLEL